MTAEPGPEPGLRSYLIILRQQRWWVISAALLGLACGLALSFAEAKQYTATAQVLVQSADTSPALGAAQQPVSPTDVQTELQLVTSAPVRQAVRRQLGSEPAVSASEVEQANVIAITATSTSPARAARVANTYARGFVAYQQRVAISSLAGAESQLREQIASIAKQVKSVHAAGTTNAAQTSALLNQEAVLKEQLAQLQVNGAVATGGVELVTPAHTPTSPSSPKPAENALLGVAAGMLLGLGVAALRNNLNDKLSSKETVEQLGGAPVLALVPLVGSWKKRERAVLVSATDPTSPAAESYRSLRTSLQFLRHERQLRSLVITSPAAAEGKTSTVANLGALFAQAGERVVVISGDLRRPRLGQFFRVDEDTGLTSVLLGHRSLDDVIQQVAGHRNLWTLAAGPVTSNPAELLNSAAARDIFAALRTKFDLVLIDSPPVLPVTDAVVLSKAADATLLVVAAGQTKRGDLQRAAEKFEQVSAPVVGIVLNEVSKQAGYAYGYGYGYGYQPYLPAIAKPAEALHGNGRTAPADVGRQP